MPGPIPPNANPSLESLFERAGAEQEIQIDAGDDRLRIVLRTDDMDLWRAHRRAHPGGNNLLLACESGSVALAETRLTWVVGAAIRQALVGDQSEALELLQTLGISQPLLALVESHCSGLAETVVWAFHWERHGWLTATPVDGWP